MKQIGPYQVLCQIGEGGMAIVYKAQRFSEGPVVALKLMKEDAGSLADLHARFLRETRILSRLKHPNIIRFIDRGIHQDRPYMVTEYARLGDLRGFLSVHQPPLKARLGIIHDICCGLETAHEIGVIHRDLKPGNILITDQKTAKITDFGIATALWVEQSRLTRTGDTLGTLDYIAPEQKISAGQVDFRCDHYAIGVILYEMITGHKPLGFFRPPKQITPKIPERLNRLVITCLSPEPAERYTTTTQLKLDLAGIIDEMASLSNESDSIFPGMDRDTEENTIPDIHRLIQDFDSLPLQRKLASKAEFLNRLKQLPTAAVLSRLDSSESLTKECLIESLAGRKETSICSAMIEMLHNPYYNEKAVMVLTELNCPETEKSLLEMLTGNRPYAHLAIKPLGRLRSEKAVVPISGFLSHELAWIRALAMEALAEIGLPRCRKLIGIQSRKDPDPENRAKAQQLLRRVSS